jgi:hypothetical protein
VIIMEHREDNGRILLTYKNLRRLLCTSRMSPMLAEQYVDSQEPTPTSEDILRGRVDPMLVRLASSLCASYPQYEFQLAPRAAYINAPCYAIVAWKGETKLGSISCTHSGYELENDRIRKKLKRGGSKKTGSLDTALAIFKREFKPPSEVEGLEAANESICRILSRAKQNMNYNVRPLVPTAIEIRDLKEESLALLLKVLELQGVPDVDREKYAEAYETYRAIKSITYPKPVGLVIKIGDDGNYYTQQYNNRAFDGHLTALPVDSYSPESLPESLRSGIGLLKLLEDDSFLVDVGYRLNNNSFFVRGTNESTR